MIEVGDDAELARILIELLGDSSAAKHMGENGRNKYKRLFTWERVSESILDEFCNHMPKQ